MNAYLHYHHRNVREASTGLIAPKKRSQHPGSHAASVTSQFGRPSKRETLYLDDQPYLFGDAVSICDLSAYVEIGQLQSRFTNTYDFSELPNVSAWLERMQQLPFHDEVHVCLTEMGDISQEAPSMDVIRNANISGLKALKAALDQSARTQIKASALFVVNAARAQSDSLCVAPRHPADLGSGDLPGGTARWLSPRQSAYPRAPKRRHYHHCRASRRLNPALD